MLTELYGGSENAQGHDHRGELRVHGTRLQRGGPPSDGYNLIVNTAGCSFTNTTGDKVNKNPRLDPVGSYGGPTQTMLDQGDQPGAEAVPTSLCTVHSDQRGCTDTGSRTRCPRRGRPSRRAPWPAAGSP
jgi:hypothetical protein